MRMRRARILLMLCIAVGVLSSCATTSLLTSWVEPTAQGKKFEKVLVLGVGKNAVLRRQFEDSFAKVLASRKIDAVASYPMLPDPAAIDEESVKPVVQQQGITQIMVVRLVDRKTVTTYVPPTTTTAYVGGYPGYYPGYYGTWSGYYGMGYSTVTSPGYTYDTEYVNLETNVYDVASGKLIWSGLTETEVGSRVQSQIDEFIQVISGAMIRDKLI